MSQRTVIGIGLALALLGGAVVVLSRTQGSASSAAPGASQAKDAAASVDDDKKSGRDTRPALVNSLIIGHREGPATPQIHTILTTRKGDTTYQALIRYNPVPAPLSEVPGLMDVLQVLNQRAVQLPQQVLRIDQETETLADNLGEPLRSVTSTHFYLNPVNGQVIAYDIANSTGGQAQRFVGHITRTGATVEVFRGSQSVDRHEVPFAVRETFIPVEMEFIHQWFQVNPDARQKAEPVKFSVFIPEVMAFVWLVAKPLGSQVIPVKDRNYDCERYDVRTVSTQGSEGLQARQEMWFDKRSGLLMKREDFETTFAPGDAPVTERGGPEDLAKVRPLVVRAPELPEKTFPYQFGEDLVYRVRVGDGELGQVSFQFKRADSTTAGADGQFISTARVNLEARGAVRHESAVTRFNSRWQAVSYLAAGDEMTDAKATYKVEANVGQGKAEVTIQRQIEPAAAVQPAPAPKAGVPSALPESDWHDPLKRVPIGDDEAGALEAALLPRVVSQTFGRTLYAGTYLFDHNRLEHLAAVACRFPLPLAAQAGEKPSDAPAVAWQKVAFYAVRQNRSGVVLFEIRPEPKPVLTERQQLRLTPAERNEPRLYVASATSSLLPCKMLLAPDGRLMELSLKHGNQEVVYTLDDPIMHRRAERAKKQKLQEGPQIIRPPWW